MTHIEAFIRDNKDWESIITAEPYFIKVKRDEEFPHLVSLSYSQIESDFSLPIVRECRGIIIDIEDAGNPKVVCHAFDKFFNYGEPWAAEIDWSSARVQEKIDGSIVKLWYYDKANKWILSSNSCIQAKNAELESGYNIESLFVYAAKNYTDCESVEDFAEKLYLVKSFTFIFELVSPYNQVVIQYKDPKIYLIGLRSMTTDLEFDSSRIIFLKDLPHPASYALSSLEDCIDFLSTINSGDTIEHEGFVVVDRNYNRIKIKTEEYVALHHTANGLSEEGIIHIIRANEISEVLTYFPKYEYKIKEMLRDYESYRKKLFIKTVIARKVWEKLGKDRKAFALAYKSKNFPEVFKLLDMDWNWRKYVNDLTEKQLLKNIKRAN